MLAVHHHVLAQNAPTARVLESRRAGELTQENHLGGVPDRVRGAGAARPWPDAPAGTIAALGHWGQGLYVMPQEKLVVVRYADDRDRSFQHNELLKRVQAAFATEVQP